MAAIATAIVRRWPSRTPQLLAEGSRQDALEPRREGGEQNLRERLCSIPYTGRVQPGDGKDDVSETLTYTVPGMHCKHCEAAVMEELGAVSGVEVVEVDLVSKRVVVNGSQLSDEALRAAIEEAGYKTAA